MKNNNDLILERLRGVPMQKGTLRDRFDPRNPNRQNANDNEEEMSKKPKPGSNVQIGGKPYTVLEGPFRHGAFYRIMARSEADQGSYWAISEDWRGGCGPWHISGPVIDEFA